jgi:hypothetical protein
MMKRALLLLFLIVALLGSIYSQQGMGPGPGLGRGGSVASIFVNDTFTEASDTVITSHTGETGATWTKHGDSTYGTTVTVDGASDRVYPTSNPAAFYASGTPANANYSVCADIFAHTNIAMNIGPCGRMDTTNNTMYCARYNSGTSWDLRKVIENGGSDTQTTLSTSSSNLITLGTSKRLCVVMSGTTISMTVNGATEGSPVTDTDISAAGRAGFRSSGGSTPSTGFNIDNLTAQ